MKFFSGCGRRRATPLTMRIARSLHRGETPGAVRFVGLDLPEEPASGHDLAGEPEVEVLALPRAFDDFVRAAVFNGHAAFPLLRDFGAVVGGVDVEFAGGQGDEVGAEEEAFE